MVRIFINFNFITLRFDILYDDFPEFNTMKNTYQPGSLLLSTFLFTLSEKKTIARISHVLIFFRCYMVVISNKNNEITLQLLKV